MNSRLILSLPFLLAGCHQPAAGPPPQMPPAPVTLEAVEEREIVEWEEFTGRVEALETVELRPRVSGYITEVRAHVRMASADIVAFHLGPQANPRGRPFEHFSREGSAGIRQPGPQ